jgi:uncharacterized protein (TIGR02453 family)
MTDTFSAATWAVLDRLSHDNTTTTFEALRGAYHDDVAAPSAAFVERMAVLLPERVHPGLRAEAKVGRSLFRINRDTRFSKDKTPYKTHLDFLFWIGDGPPREQPACILRLTAADVLLGAGQMGLRSAVLDRYRQRLDEPDGGARLRNIAADLVARGAELSEPKRAKPPRPYPAEHLNAELLRRDGFHLTSRHPHPASITTSRFPAWCATRLAPYRALLDWLADG